MFQDSWSVSTCGFIIEGARHLLKTLPTRPSVWRIRRSEAWRWSGRWDTPRDQSWIPERIFTQGQMQIERTRCGVSNDLKFSWDINTVFHDASR